MCNHTRSCARAHVIRKPNTLNCRDLHPSLDSSCPHRLNVFAWKILNYSCTYTHVWLCICALEKPAQCRVTLYCVMRDTCSVCSIARDRVKRHSRDVRRRRLWNVKRNELITLCGVSVATGDERSLVYFVQLVLLRVIRVIMIHANRGRWH